MQILSTICSQLTDISTFIFFNSYFNFKNYLSEQILNVFIFYFLLMQCIIDVIFLLKIYIQIMLLFNYINTCKFQ